MARRIVIKRLSASDLTLFECHFRNTAGTKQKAFNLDRDVFIDLLYPGLPGKMDVTKDRIPLDLSIFGPGMASLHNLQRKILKQQKNWRLDGELIYNPTENENRYTPLRKGDFAILDFAGDSEPHAARLFLISRAVAEDTKLYASLDGKYSPGFSLHKSMAVIEQDELADLISRASLTDGHPVLDLVDEDALEDAVENGIVGIQRLKKRRKARGVRRDEFERAKRSAELVGRQGEELLNLWLAKQLRQKAIPGFRWESEINVVAPYDFLILEGDKPIRSIDAKSTSGQFGSPLHISLSELIEMAEGGRPYDIYRLYGVTENSASLRILKDAGKVARQILDALGSVPKGVTVDSISLDPRVYPFEGEIVIESRENEEPETE